MKPLAFSEKQSRLLGRVRQQGTSAELAVGQLMRELGLHYRKNVRGLPGSPDFANRQRGWAVFVHGCFWHAHTGCARATLPKNNREFWREKFTRNRGRDAAAIRELRSTGFEVLLVWECEVAAAKLRLARLVPGRHTSRAKARSSIRETGQIAHGA